MHIEKDELMSRRICCAALVCVVCRCSSASAWLLVIPKESLSDPVTGLSGDWFAARESPVHLPILGYMINGSGHYYFAGKTVDLNQFLERTALAADGENVHSWYQQVSRHVVVHPGAGYARIPGTQSEAAGGRAQWKLELLRSSDLVPDNSGIVNTLTIKVHVWIDDTIRLDDLSVPPGFAVVSGGEIDRFVRDKSQGPAQ